MYCATLDERLEDKQNYQVCEHIQKKKNVLKLAQNVHNNFSLSIQNYLDSFTSLITKCENSQQMVEMVKFHAFESCFATRLQVFLLFPHNIFAEAVWLVKKRRHIESKFFLQKRFQM
jgi:hypothetical protein